MRLRKSPSYTDLYEPVSSKPVKSSFTSRAKQAFQLSQQEARMKDMTTLPQGPQTRPVKSSITSRFKQAYQLGKKENVVGKFLQPKVLGVGKKSPMVSKILSGGVGKIGLGLGLGFASDIAADQLKQFRNENLGIDWTTVDGIVDAISLGATFINPVLGAAVKPVMGALSLTAQETVKNNAVGGGFTMSNDDAAFLVWLAKEIEKDTKAKQKPGAIPLEQIGTLEYQNKKKEEFTKLKGYYDDFEFMEWYSDQVKKDRADAGFGVDDFGDEYRKRKRAEWDAMKEKPKSEEEEDGGTCEIVYLDPDTNEEVPDPGTQSTQPQNQSQPSGGKN